MHLLKIFITFICTETVSVVVNLCVAKSNDIITYAQIIFCIFLGWIETNNYMDFS